MAERQIVSALLSGTKALPKKHKNPVKSIFYEVFVTGLCRLSNSYTALL
jgi:hypothetical protein